LLDRIIFPSKSTAGKYSRFSEVIAGTAKVNYLAAPSICINLCGGTLVIRVVGDSLLNLLWRTRSILSLIFGWRLASAVSRWKCNTGLRRVEYRFPIGDCVERALRQEEFGRALPS